MIDCIIFDCDGTLVDSEYLCNFAFELKLRDYGIELSAQEMLTKYRGLKLSIIIESIESDYAISFKKDFVPSYRKLVSQLFEEELTPCDGVIEVLNNLDIPVCVASSGSREKIEKALSVTGLSEYFGNNIFSSYQINSWKPSPEIFRYAAAEMGFESSQCAVVEDSEVGIEAALAARMLAVYYNPHSLKLKIDNMEVISDMRDLRQAIIKC